MNLAYSRELELEDNDDPLSRRRRERFVDDGLCEVCHRNRADHDITVHLYGNVEQMPVGGKTYQRTKIIVGVCRECSQLGYERGRKGGMVCLISFFLLGVPFAVLCGWTSGSMVGGLIGGVLMGGLLTVPVSEYVRQTKSRESICSSVPRVKVLLDAGWKIGESPTK